MDALPGCFAQGLVVTQNGYQDAIAQRIEQKPCGKQHDVLTLNGGFHQAFGVVAVEIAFYRIMLRLIAL